jgi:hypothetical protein
MTLEEYAKQLSKVTSEYPDLAEKELRKLANSFKKIAIEKTPELEKTPDANPGSGDDNDKHRLKKSYHISRTQQAGDNLYIEFYSSSPHYHLVERGYYITDASGNVHGWKPGVFMVENTGKELDAEAPAELEKWLNKMVKRYNL